MPTLGFIVVKGKSAIGTIFIVAAAKKVDLPTFGFPRIPTIMTVSPAGSRCGSGASEPLLPLLERFAAPRSDDLNAQGGRVKSSREFDAALAVEAELRGRTEDHLSAPQ